MLPSAINMSFGVPNLTMEESIIIIITSADLSGLLMVKFIFKTYLRKTLEV